MGFNLYREGHFPVGNPVLRQLSMDAQGKKLLAMRHILLMLREDLTMTDASSILGYRVVQMGTEIAQAEGGIDALLSADIGLRQEDA